ncbi:MAG: GNAT family N-acetyltransferase, partial [Planctomycetota bacterium]
MERPLLEITTDRLLVQVPPVSAAGRILDYCVRNREHLAPWEPYRPDEYFTLPFWRNQVLGARDEYLAGSSVRTILLRRDPAARDKGRGGPVVGVANLTQIVRGVLQAAYLGYSLEAEAQGEGLMTEALEALVGYAFDELDLHRVMANYIPENGRSAGVL